MVENLKVHAELSLMSDDGLDSEYRISLKSDSLKDTIPEEVADKIKNMLKQMMYMRQSIRWEK